MGNPAYLATNLVNSIAAITSSGADTVYPVGNLYDRLLSNPSRWSALGGGWIEIDFGTVVTADIVGIMGHNFYSNVALTIKAGNSANPSTVITSPVFRTHDIYNRFTQTSARYWRFIVTDPTNPYKSYIGELFLGLAVELIRRPSWQHEQGDTEEGIEQRTNYGTEYVYPLFKQWSGKYVFRSLADSLLTQLKNLHDGVRGKFLPFLWIPDLAKTPCYLVRKQKEWTQTALEQNDYWDIPLDLLEESHGVDIEE